MLKEAYNSLVERFREAGLKPPPFKAYRQTPPAVRKLLKRMLEKWEKTELASSEEPKSSGKKLPDMFRIVGNWVSCAVMPDGKTVLVSGEDLELQEGEGW